MRPTKPRAMARPSPEPRSPFADVPRTNGSKTRSRSWSRDPRPTVDHVEEDLAALSRRVQRDPLAEAGELERILDHVDEGAFELGRVDLDRRNVVRADRRRHDPRRLRSRRVRGLQDRRLSTAPESAWQHRLRGARARGDSRRGGPVAAPARGSRRSSSSRSSSGRESPSSRSTSLAVVIAVIGERRSWLTERSTAVLTASLRRSASASTASRRRRSSLARASSIARSVSRRRSSASSVRRRARSESALTLIAVTRYTASATQFSESASRNVCVGGRKSQLKASMLTIETGIANGRPQSAATGSTAKR